MGQYPQAKGFYRQWLSIAHQWLSIAQAIESPHDQAQALGALGNVNHKLSQYSQAIDFYQQSLALS